MKKILDLYFAFFRVGGLTFGGGYAMLPILQREVVTNHHWSTEEEVMDMYAIGQCTPGIIAVNTATFIGYKQAGFLGSVSATLGVITPSLIIICLIASILNNFLDLPIVIHALAGIRIAVCAMMLNTVVNMAKKGIVDVLGGILFVTAFILACFTPIPTALLIVIAGVIGIVAKKIGGEQKI